jgi:hypothetical protein
MDPAQCRELEETVVRMQRTISCIEFRKEAWERAKMTLLLRSLERLAGHFRKHPKDWNRCIYFPDVPLYDYSQLTSGLLSSWICVSHLWQQSHCDPSWSPWLSLLERSSRVRGRSASPQGKWLQCFWTGDKMPSLCPIWLLRSANVGVGIQCKLMKEANMESTA